MVPKEKGWLRDYLEFRKGLFLDLTLEAGRRSSHPEQALYRIIQPTGLMYGYTIDDLNLPDNAQWDEKDRMKVLLAESLISSSLLFHDKPITNHDELSSVILQTLQRVNNFYNNIFPELSTPAKTLFGKKRSPLELAERILDKRIQHTNLLPGNFWTSFFHNSLLFLDIFIFGQWIHTKADRIVADFFRYEREELRFSLLKVIAAAAHANRKVSFEEKKLFEYFLAGTELSSTQKKEALKIFEGGIAIEDINLPSENSWILKKYFIEIVILTLWADKKVEQEELDFLKRVSHYFEFSDEDLEISLIAIESFVLENWDKLDNLQENKDYGEVSEQFIKRISGIAQKNRGTLMKEMEHNKHLMELLKRARANGLSTEEKEQVRLEIIQILKSIPTFVILSLPQKFLTLPILLKILPNNMLSDI